MLNRLEPSLANNDLSLSEYISFSVSDTFC